MSVITTSVADKTSNLSFKRLTKLVLFSQKRPKTLMNAVPPLSSNPGLHLNLISRGISAIQNPVSLSKTMPCWWLSLKTSRDNGSNTNREALNYCCNSLSLYCSYPPRPSAPPLLLISRLLSDWVKVHHSREGGNYWFAYLVYLWPR